MSAYPPVGPGGPQQPPQPPMPPQQPPGGGYYQPGPPQPSAPSEAGFFSALFDFSFTKFVTISFAKIIYILAIAVVVAAWLIIIIASFLDGIGNGLAALLLGWIPALLYIVFIRVGIEFTVAMIRTAINTGDMARRR